MLVMNNVDAERIREHASSSYPEECVGALLGTLSEASHSTSMVIPLQNASDSKSFRYSIQPSELLALEKTAEEHGLDVIGFYHSHPNAPAIPSSVDAQAAWPFYAYLIVSVMRGRPEKMAAWKLEEQNRRFVPLEMVIS